MKKLIKFLFKRLYSMVMTFMTFSMDHHTPKALKHMKHANFTFQLHTQGSRRCIVITDNTRSVGIYKSVTLDIVWVIEQIELAAGIRAEDWVIVYRDNTGRWDGWNAGKGKYIMLGARDWPAAVAKFVAEALQLQHA